MMKPYSKLPHHDLAIQHLEYSNLVSKKELNKSAYRIRNAFQCYLYSIEYKYSDEDLIGMTPGVSNYLGRKV